MCWDYSIISIMIYLTFLSLRLYTKLYCDFKMVWSMIDKGVAASIACHAHFSWKVCFFTFSDSGQSLIVLWSCPSRVLMSTIRPFKWRIVGFCIFIGCWENWRNVTKNEVRKSRVRLLLQISVHKDRENSNNYVLCYVILHLAKACLIGLSTGNIFSLSSL